MSTREEVGELSGRGVGMSAVKAELQDVGYGILVQSEQAQGTRFRLQPVELEKDPGDAAAFRAAG